MNRSSDKNLPGKDSGASLRGTLASVRNNIWFALSIMWRINRRLLLQSGLIYAMQGLVPIAIAYLTGRIIDSVVESIAAGTVLPESLFILALIGVLQVAFSQSFNMQFYIGLRLRKDFSAYLTENVLRKFHTLDHSHYESTSFNKQMNKIKKNISIITYTPERTLQLLTSVLQLVATILTIIFLSPGIVFLLIVSIVPLVIALTRIAKRRWKIWDNIDQELRLRNRLESTASDVDQISELKIFGLNNYFRDLWRKYYNRTEGERIRVEHSAQRKLLLTNIFEGFVQFGVIVWLLVRVVRDAAFSLGDFEFYRRLIGDFTNASGRMAASFQSLSESNLYLKDYQDLMAQQPRVEVKQTPVPLDNGKTASIEFKDVSFRYPGSKRYVLRHLSLTIKPGEDIAFVGENGAGKTSLIKLLMRFYDVTEGEILIDGKNIKDIDLVQWYGQVGVLFQNFNRYSYFKARRSIGIGDVDRVGDIEGIKSAATTAGADKYIDKLPEKYETVLSKQFDDGTDLSGGEWQRIALARAFFRDANILILDEPTSAVDAKAEYEIFQRIAKTQKDKTTIIISHRFSTVRNADTIHVVDSGTIKESGSHRDLMSIEDGIYRQMFELQAEGYK